MTLPPDPHLALVRPVAPHTREGCEDCLRIGSSWVHLRLCLTCGQSFEPGETWRWCFVDERMT